jgi:hypothetical protein
MQYNYCPACGCAWNAWGETVPPITCWSCGFDIASITRIPDSCPEHPKYKAIGKPATDCPTCWLMYKANVDGQAAQIIEKGEH